MAFTPYVLPYLVAAITAIGFVFLARKRRGARGVAALTLVALAAAYWCLLNAVEVAGVSLAVKRTAANLEYLASWLPALWLVFCLQYAGRLPRIDGRLVVALSLVPVITNVLLWIPDLRLLRYDLALSPTGPLLTVSHGPWFYVMSAYSYALMAAATGIIAESLAHAHRLFRVQGLLLVLATVLPLAASGAHVLGVGPLAVLDLTPAMFAFAVPILLVGALRYRLLDLLPAARAAVIGTMADALLVIDLGGKVVDANPAAVRLLAGGDGPLLGQRAESLLPGLSGALPALPAAACPRSIVELPGGRLMEFRLAPIRERDEVSGWLALYHDVTERETLVRQLRAAVADVHALSGLIPICACCKRVRDDQGYWQQVESYISAHSEVEFTHGLCPDCVARLYPETESAA